MYCRRKYSHDEEVYTRIKKESFNDIDENVPLYAKQPFPVRVKCCGVRLLLIAYKAISEFVLTSIKCVPLEEGQSLTGPQYQYSISQ